MTHLHQHPDGFVFHSANVGDAVEIEVFYSLGSSVSHIPRGVYVALRPVNFHDGFKSTVLGAGGRICVRPCGARSPKKVADVAAKVDLVVPEVLAAFEVGDRQTAFDVVRKATGVQS